jgi:MFS family permease
MDRYGLETAMRWGYIALFLIGGLSSYIRQRYLKETLTKTEKSSEQNQFVELVGNFRETIKKLNRNVVTFILLDMVFTLALGLGEPYFVTYATDALHITGGQWGFVMSMVTLIHCITLMLVASPSDNGRVRFVKASMVSWPIAYYLFISSGSYAQILVTRVLVTIAAGVGQPAWSALFSDYCPREHRGRFNALLEVAWSFLYGGGNYLGGLLYQNYGLRVPFQVAIALMTVGGVTSLVFLKEPTYKEQ